MLGVFMVGGANCVADRLSAMAIRSRVLRPLRILRDYCLLTAGLARYSVEGTTPAWAYQSLVRLFCATAGRANQHAHGVVSFARRPYQIDGPSLVVDDADFDSGLSALRRDGYFVFPRKLPEDLCARLEQLARTHTTRIHPSLPKAEGRYDERMPDTETMRLNEKDLIADPDVRMLMGDPGFVRLAQSYLGPRPRIDHIGMWWSIARTGDASLEGAQEYHFDLDRIRFVQFFVYLTDCGTDDGPHCFVRGSHRPGVAPLDLLGRGYARIPDADIAARFPREDIVEICGSRGTVFAVDTLAFHKGKPPRRHDRLVLQIVMCDSLFGANKPRLPVSVSGNDPLATLGRRHPDFVSRFETVS